MGRRDTLLLSILTMVTALAWIAFDVYHASIDTTITAEVQAQLAPITPTFDKNVVDDVKKRQDVDPVVTQGARLFSPSPTRVPSSPSAGISTATPSADL